jgi:hypothetical protein
MVSGLDVVNSPPTHVVIAHVGSVTADDIVITCFDFAFTRLAVSVSTLDALVI